MLPAAPGLHSRDFRHFQAARLLSIIGVQMQSVAVGWLVYDLTRRPLDLGWVGLAQFLPAMVFSLFAGHTADTFDRRRILMTCHLALSCCSGLLLTAALTHASPWVIYAILALFGAARAFMGPASQTLVTNLVPAESMGRAVAISSVMFEIATIVGPMLGGALYAAGQGAVPVFCTSGTLSLLAAAGIASLHVDARPLERAPRSLGTLLAGVRYVGSNRLLLGALSLDLFAVLLGGAIALLPAFARDVLSAGPTALGVLRSAPAVGAGATALWLARHPLSHHAGARMLAGVGVFGLATLAFGLGRSLAFCALSLAVAGAADMLSVVVRMTLVQLATPPEMRGRVSAVNSLFIGASNELGEFESGVTAAWLGVVPAILVGGMGTLAVLAIWMRLFPELRRVDSLLKPMYDSDARPA